MLVAGVRRVSTVARDQGENELVLVSLQQINGREQGNDETDPMWLVFLAHFAPKCYIITLTHLTILD